ncbi:MAG: hypothetical protein JWO72_325 [Caulobacteraceae bacterium]|jgi:hypothetical protein|nr:hypothetical protein [Caulobacteraceae bacterium]
MALVLVRTSTGLPALVALPTPGHVLFLALPLIIGLPLAGLMRRRR